MPKKIKMEVPTLIELKRDEVFWDGKKYELSFRNDPKFDTFKKIAEEKVSHIREQISELYPIPTKWLPINEWLIEQANLLSVAFWNHVHENEDYYTKGALLYGTTFYVYKVASEGYSSQGAHHKYPTGGFSIWEGAPWNDDSDARLIVQTENPTLFKPEELYKIKVKNGYTTFEYTDFFEEYSWRFLVNFYRALRNANVVYKDKFKVITDRLTFKLDVL